MMYKATKTNKIISFNDLKAWQEAHVLVLLVYKHTAGFPDLERFGLTNQIRRAAISVTSNIAEGFGRQTAKEKIQFYYHANGSLLEIKSQLFAARDLHFITQDTFAKITEKADMTQALLKGLMRTATTKA